MISTASRSISLRTSCDGHGSPKMCSFSASPVPTPKKNRPGSIVADVAAACAITAGWMRTVGQVTAVPTGTRSVTCAIAPMTDQTNALCPCASVHGW